MSNAEKPLRKKSKGYKFWLWIKHFTMKWRFRIDQARSIFGLITFALILAQSYAKYIPWISDPDNVEFWVIIVFGLVIFVIFVFGGYLYDRMFKLWTETQTVTVERNPYTYVPQPKEFINNLAIFSFIFDSLTRIAEKLDVDLKGKEIIRAHLKTYYDLNTKVVNFENEALKLKVLSKELQRIFIESGQIHDYDEFFRQMLEEAEKAKAEKLAEKAELNED